MTKRTMSFIAALRIPGMRRKQLQLQIGNMISVLEVDIVSRQRCVRVLGAQIDWGDTGEELTGEMR